MVGKREQIGYVDDRHLDPWIRGINTDGGTIEPPALIRDQRHLPLGLGGGLPPEVG